MAAEIVLPSGTVTFLFTDIEDSTALWDSASHEMSAAVARHDQITREVVGRFDGYVFTTAGDSFAVAFARARDAVGAAAELQLALSSEVWPGSAAIRVRMGVHIGEADERNGDYFGTAVNTAARVMGLSRGGQILVSRAVEEIVRDELPYDASLDPVGQHRLRGLTRPEALFQLSVPGLEADFGPLATSRSGNLPLPSTSFVGRSKEVSHVAAAIESHRLVTLIGPGGMGKTRLAIEAAAAASDEFPDGLWFIELAPLALHEAVVPAVAATMSISIADSAGGRAQGSLLDSIVEVLTGRRVLLILDNCEHVIEATSELAAALRTRAPTATVLTTSREPLRVPGEQLYPLEPMDPAVEGVELFLERASAVDPSFATRDDQRVAVSELCHELDGMPLAIELAAARVRSMTVPELHRRLDDRFRLLRGSRRGDTSDRQQTLLATVQWSYDLLDAASRLLFDRVGIFTGGFDLSLDPPIGF